MMRDALILAVMAVLALVYTVFLVKSVDDDFRKNNKKKK